MKAFRHILADSSITFIEKSKEKPKDWFFFGSNCKFKSYIKRNISKLYTETYSGNNVTLLYNFIIN